MKPLVYCSTNTQRTTFKAPSCALSTTPYGSEKKITKKKPASLLRCQRSDSRVHVTGIACTAQKYVEEGSFVRVVFSITDAGFLAVLGWMGQ